MARGFHGWFVFADDAVRFNQHGRFEQSAAHVTLVSAGFFAAAVWAFSFYEAVRQEPLVVFAVKHLGVLLEDVAVFLDFEQRLLDKLFVDWTFGACVIVK